MFNLSISSNSRVNGFAASISSKHDHKDPDSRKRKGKVVPSSFLNGPIKTTNGGQSSSSNSASNAGNKFSERLKSSLDNSFETPDHLSQQTVLKDSDDPYTFIEPEPLLHQYDNSFIKSSKKMPARSLVKTKSDRIGHIVGSCEPTGLNMTRLYPAISASLGHSFFSQESVETASPPHGNDINRTTLASLLESAVNPDELMPRSSELEKTFSSFTAKDLNCFPNLTSPPPPEQVSSGSVPIVTSKISPVKHGMPSTPQRESNKLAALFSPTYPNVRTDRAKSAKTSARAILRDKPSRVPQSEKRSNAVSGKNATSILDASPRKGDETSKSTMNRLQDKIARNRVIGRQNRKVESAKGNSDAPPRRHSTNDIPVKRERSLLEEQLLGFKPSKQSKREDLPNLTPPPSATTRVPGMIGSLTYGIARSSPNSPRSTGSNSFSARQNKPQATYTTPKSSKALATQKQGTTTYGPAASRQLTSGSLLTSSRSHVRQDTNRAQKRSRLKMDITADSVKNETLQRLQVNKEAKHDPFNRPTVVETDSDDSDLDEGLVYQKHWFSGWREAGSGLAGEERREGRLSQLRAELRRKLNQVWAVKRDPAQSALPKCVINAALNKPSQTAVLLSPKNKWRRTGRSKLSMLVRKQCVFGRQGSGEPCLATALPCAHHCVRHIMYNVDQLLFEHCTAKFSDNTQCCVPVFDFCHELPLCTEHARKLDNYNRMCQETKPKKVRKKAKPSAMTRSSKRNKKKKQKIVAHAPGPQISSSQPLAPLLPHIEPPPQAQTRVQRSQSLPVESRRDSEDCYDSKVGVETSSSPTQSGEIFVTDDSYVTLNDTDVEVRPIEVKVEHIQDVSAVDVGEEEVLAMAVDLPLDTADLAQQETGLVLEEHDLTNVLNQIPADAFNDLLFEDKNSEPTREETEELERALAAVDKDVKSLERMSEGQILLDYKAQDLLQTPHTQAQVYLEVDKLSQSHGLLDIDKIQTQALFDEKHAQGLLDNFLDDQTLVQTLTAQLPTDLPSSSTGLVYYHNGYAVAGTAGEKNLVANSTPALYSTSAIVGVPLSTQPDLHS